MNLNFLARSLLVSIFESHKPMSDLTFKNLEMSRTSNKISINIIIAFR